MVYMSNVLSWLFAEETLVPIYGSLLVQSLSSHNTSQRREAAP